MSLRRTGTAFGGDQHAARPGSFNDKLPTTFLTELHELLDGDKATVIWDGLPSECSSQAAKPGGNHDRGQRAHVE